jgi:hypothetical protein
MRVREWVDTQTDRGGTWVDKYSVMNEEVGSYTSKSNINVKEGYGVDTHSVY